MSKYTPKSGEKQGGQHHEYVIRQLVFENGKLNEYYLKDIGIDRVRDLLVEDNFGRKDLQKKKKPPEPPKEENINVTAMWTQDETQAIYFQSLGEAEKIIRKWKLLRKYRQVTIIQA